MSTGVLSIRLPDELKARLDALSTLTGRPAAYYVRDAIAEHLDELEYAYTLTTEAEAIRRGDADTRPWETLLDALDITRADLDAIPSEFGDKDIG